MLSAILAFMGDELSTNFYPLLWPILSAPTPAALELELELESLMAGARQASRSISRMFLY